MVDEMQSLISNNHEVMQSMLSSIPATIVATTPFSGFPDVRKLGVSKFRTFRKSEGTDRLLLNIDVDADLAPAFNWNVKQLFAFVVAEYKTKTNPINQARPQQLYTGYPCSYSVLSGVSCL